MVICGKTTGFYWQKFLMQGIVMDARVWLLTRCFPPIIGRSSDIIIPGVAPLNQFLHYSEEIHAWKIDNHTGQQEKENVSM